MAFVLVGALPVVLKNAVVPRVATDVAGWMIKVPCVLASRVTEPASEDVPVPEPGASSKCEPPA